MSLAVGVWLVCVANSLSFRYCYMCLCAGCLRDLASILLLVTMTGAAYSHHALNDDVDKMTPSLVCGALLLLRLITSKLLCSSDRARCQKKPAAATEMHTKSE